MTQEFSIWFCILCYNLYTSHHAVSLANSLGITKCLVEIVGGGGGVSKDSLQYWHFNVPAQNGLALRAV